MYSSHVGATLAVLLPLLSSFHIRAQSAPNSAEAKPVATTKRIVVFDHTLPDLDPLRAAIRARNPGAAQAAVASIEEEARLARAEFTDALERMHGRILREWWIVDGMLVEIPIDALDALEGMPGVRSVWENSTRAPGDAKVASTPILTSTNTANHASDVVNARGVRGAGVTVAVVDSGLDSDMAGLGRPHRTFFLQGNPGNQTGGGIGGSRMLANIAVGALPADDSIDHGTRVAGVAIGAKWNTLATSDDGHAPEARVIGYSLVEISGGLTELSTMVQAWQNCALDAATYGTKVAVISYDGTNTPLSPEQAAMDACAEIADVVIAAMAGNSPTNQLFYQGASNILSVGATQQDNRVVASFSAVGPISSQGVTPRRYPSCVANGDVITMPSADFENTAVTRSGTSYAAPQVAGAAALFRSVSSVSADATRAAIAATLEDARGPNFGHESAIGLGYLRDDQLCDLGSGIVPGTVADGSVDLFNPTWTTTVQVNQGEVWAIALAWSRRDVSRVEWANLDLRVSLNGRELGTSRSTGDTIEHCVVQATATGTLQIEVSATSFEIGRVTQSFGVAAARSTRPTTRGYGIGCESHRLPNGALLGVEPSNLSATFANSGNDLLLGGNPHRTMQWIDTPSLNAAFSATGIAFRRDDGPATWPRAWVDLSMTLSLTGATSASMSNAFAQNYGPRTVQVIDRKTFVLPPFPAPNALPARFDVVLPFDRPFDRLYDPLLGPNLTSVVMDVSVFANSAGTQPLSYPLDALSGFAAARSLSANSPTATTGTMQTGVASVFGFVSSFTAGFVPTITPRTQPSIGFPFSVDVRGPTGLSPVLLFVGGSNTTLGGAPLPIELSPVGAHGCYALTSMDLFVAGSTNAIGVASFSIPVPNQINLRGRSVYEQAFVADPLVNALGFCTSAGLQVVFGQ